MFITFDSRVARRLAGIREIHRIYELYRRFRFKLVKVTQWSPYENIYHCCTQKTASQWFRAIFADPIFYKYTGLAVLPYVQLGLRYASFKGPLPRRTVGAHLYIGHSTYLGIPKPGSYRTFFVLRDPRDIVVSWYFSARFSHILINPIPELRKHLQGIPLHDGLKYMIDRLEDWGSFEVQRSWIHIRNDQERARIFRYEVLAGDNFSFLKQLLDYLNIVMPEKKFAALYYRHRFERHAMGRSQGVEDRYSHYRKGVSGDWRDYFDRSTLDYFKQKTGNLLEVLGYGES